MKLFVVIFALIATAVARPQFFNGGAANAAAGSSTLNGGFPYPISGSASNAAANSNSFAGGPFSFTGSSAHASASSGSSNFVHPGYGMFGSASNAAAGAQTVG
ncbi:unnamed protein product [Chironomus riparius]|uniref:Uncharacterized protein n=1 Tax=Chironomus riparius TaxID=315576 RepID=A0A9N9S7Y5_9DIPT|nr:unnamed protein product [Chironomus riparius]